MIALACDHSAVDMKLTIAEYLKELGYEVKDFGTNSTESVHYPEYANAAANAVISGECEKGIVICGTGMGMGIAANKVKGIRCAICSEPYSARMSREHNNANMLAFGARVVGTELAKMIVKEWLSAEFEGGRHEIRVAQITSIEEKGHV